MNGLKSAAATLVLALGLTAVVATPAHASFDWCHGAGVLCFAEHKDGNGIRWGPFSVAPGLCLGVPDNLNDKISSLWNKYGIDGTPSRPLTAYKNNPCGNVAYVWGAGAYVLWIGYENNDRISAICLGRPGSGCP